MPVKLCMRQRNWCEIIMAEEQKTAPVQTRKDYTSDQGVRWCPGCGDYAILAQTQKTRAGFRIIWIPMDSTQFTAELQQSLPV